MSIVRFAEQFGVVVTSRETLQRHVAYGYDVGFTCWPLALPDLRRRIDCLRLQEPRDSGSRFT